MNLRTISALVLSVLVHLLVLSLFFYKIGEGKKTPEKKSTLETVVKLRLIPKSESPDFHVQKGNNGRTSYPTDSLVCSGRDKTYVGIGIIFNIGSYTISHAPEYYPAFKAGVRVGDVIANPPLEIVDGYIDIEVIRGYTHLRFHVKADNICFNDT